MRKGEKESEREMGGMEREREGRGEKIVAIGRGGALPEGQMQEGVRMRSRKGRRESEIEEGKKGAKEREKRNRRKATQMRAVLRRAWKEQGLEMQIKAGILAL